MMLAMLVTFDPLVPVSIIIGVSEDITLGWMTLAGVALTAVAVVGAALINSRKQGNLQDGQKAMHDENKKDHGVVYGDLVIVKEDVQKLAENQMQTREDVVEIREHILKIQEDLSEARQEVVRSSDRNYAAIEALTAGLEELKNSFARYISENPQTIKQLEESSEEVSESPVE